MADIRALLPHSKKDAKMPAEKGPQLTEAMNDLAEMRNCTACMYFEVSGLLDGLTLRRQW